MTKWLRRLVQRWRLRPFLVPPGRFHSDGWELAPTASPPAPLNTADLILSRLIAAGYDQAELAVFRTKEVPVTCRFRGYIDKASKWIAFDVILGEGDAPALIERFEVVAMEKLRVALEEAQKGD